MAQTPEQIKKRLREQGITTKQFAASHGYDVVQVYRVLNGTIKATRGKGHQIAVAIGMKDEA